MSNIQDFNAFRSLSFKASLRSLYSDIELYISLQHAKKNLTEKDVLERALFYRKVTSQFIKIFRTKNKINELYLAGIMGWSLKEYISYEKGEKACPESFFIKLTEAVDGLKELPILRNKIEECFNAGLRNLEQDLATALNNHGYRAKDNSNDQASLNTGKVIAFKTPKK